MFGLTWDNTALAADFTIDGNDFVADNGLESAVLRSLFEYRRAQPGDVLPEGVTDRHGWWADAEPVIEGDQVGSRLWLLARSKETPAVLARAEELAREALQWLLDDKVASQIDVTVEFIAGRGFGITVTIHRPEQDPTSFRFGSAWEAQAART